jgi:tetratricopeptide (TPR) repeat protein
VAFPGSDRFEPVRTLGEGGMGVVYEVFDRERNMHMALKTLHQVDANNLYRFKREFRALTDISHPNIVTLYELGSHGDDWFLTMELVEGTDIMTWVRRDGTGDHKQRPSEDEESHAPTVAGTGSHVHGRSSSASTDLTGATRPVSTMRSIDGTIGSAAPPMRPLEFASLTAADFCDEDRLRPALAQLAEALEVVHHAGMIHRDLKPSNVRVTPHGRVVLMDFGIVAELSQPESSSESHAVGTPVYMAPEQAAGDPLTPACDWYALGVILFQALTGSLPFVGPREYVLVAKQSSDAPPPSQLVQAVPPDLDRLCVALLARDPAARPRGPDVLAALGVRKEGHITELRTETPAGASRNFVGREAELVALHTAVEAVRAGRPTTVFIEGPSGMGKSTLMRRFLHELEVGSGPRTVAPVILLGRCHENESVPYKAFDTVVDNLARVLLSLPEAEVAALLPADVDLLPRLFPVLRRVPGVQRARPLGGAGPQELRTRAFATLRALLTSLGRKQPLVLVIDDLQWADKDSFELLDDLIRPPDAPPLLFVGTMRDEHLRADQVFAEAIERLAFRTGARRLLLGPLSQDEQKLLVARLLGARATGGEISAPRWAGSDGNPLFLAELVRFAAEQDQAGEPNTTATLQDVLWARISRLVPEARQLIEAVSVAGEPLPMFVLALAAELDAAGRERAMTILRVQNLVRQARHGRDPVITPYHDKVRETVIARLGEERTRGLHQRLAQALERWESAPVESLARHHLAAGDREQAATYLQSAAVTAMEKLAFDRAAALYRAVLEISAPEGAARLALLRQRGSALALAGDSPEAANVYREAAELADGPEQVELYRLTADNLLRSGQIKEGMVTLRRTMAALGVRVAQTRRGAQAGLIFQRLKAEIRGTRWTARREHDLSPRDLGRLDSLYAAASALGMIDHIRGADIQTRHLLLALGLGEERRLIRALAIEVIFRSSSGQITKAARMASDVELRAARIGEPYLIAMAKMASAAVAFFAGKLRTARETFRAVERICRTECVGTGWEHVTADYFVQVCRMNLGELVELSQEVEVGLEEAERHADVYARTLFSAQPNVWRCLLIDRPDLADPPIERALSGWPKDDFMLTQLYLLMGRVIAWIYDGRMLEARELLQRIWRHMRENLMNQIPYINSEIQRYMGLVALALGDAREAARRARTLERLKTHCTPGLALLYRAVLVGRRGEREEAARMTLRAVQMIEDAEYAGVAQAARYQLGVFLGEHEGGRMRLDARQWFETQGVLDIEKFVATLAPRFAVTERSLART